MQYQLGFLGAGNMAEAIVRAAITKGVLDAKDMIASDPAEARRMVFDKLGVATAAFNTEVIKQSKQVLIAVKPQVMAQAAADLAKHGHSEQVLISIMAGVTTRKLADTIRAAPGSSGGRNSGGGTSGGGTSGGGASARIVRVMPNTPLQVGYGMAGLCLGGDAKPGDEALAMRLFTAGGAAIVVDESAIDAITAVSGSGPAYLFYLAEAMEKAARELGLGEHAPLLVRQTLIGAAHLLAESGEPPADLRRKVTSPGGTTEAAIRHMEGNKSIDVIINAIKAAQARSVELGK